MVAKRANGVKVEPAATLGELVGRLRAARGWSVEDLAVRAGLNPSTIDHIEQGRGSNFDTVRKLARALGVPLSDFDRALPEPARRTRTGGKLSAAARRAIATGVLDRGEPAKDLAAAHGVSLGLVYQIVARERAARGAGAALSRKIG